MQLFRPFNEDEEIPEITEWKPNKEQEVFKHADKVLIAPISRVFGTEVYPLLDSFSLKPKSAYNNPKTREHFCLYLNYYLAYYDHEQSLLGSYACIKYKMDYNDQYPLYEFKDDICKYILTPSRLFALDLMNQRNFALNLKFNTNKEVLAYKNKHGLLLMKISMLMKMCIPLISHYMFKNQEYQKDINGFMLEMYDLIFNLFDTDIRSKIYETSVSIIERSIKSNPIWNLQDIRGISETTHAITSLDQVICNLIPRYNYEKNVIKFNHTSLESMIKYQVTHKQYEYDYYAHQPTMDTDSEDEEDKFEDTLAKQDQSMILQTKFNYRYVMNKLEMKYGPIDPKEIEFFVKELSDEDGKFVLNPIQRELVFLYFYKYFGDPNGVIGNRDDYVKMLLILKKMLLATNNMVILPYILTGKIVRSFNKTSLKKSERVRLKKSPYYPMLQNKYRNEKIMNYIDAVIATLITLKVYFVSYDDPSIHGQKIPIKTDLLVEEILQFILNI